MPKTLLIDDVRFDNLRYSRSSGQHSAVVILTARDRTLCLQGRVKSGETTAWRDLSAALLDDALRQVHRLPEFRCGQLVLALRDEALPAIAFAA